MIECWKSRNPCFQSPKDTQQLQHCSPSITAVYASSPGCPGQTGPLSSPPLGSEGQSRDKTLALSFHFTPPKATDNSKTFARGQPSIPIVGGPQNCFLVKECLDLLVKNKKSYSSFFNCLTLTAATAHSSHLLHLGRRR